MNERLSNDPFRWYERQVGQWQGVMQVKLSVEDIERVARRVVELLQEAQARK